LLARKIVNSGVTDTGQIIGLDAVATLDGDGHLNSSYGARTWGGIYINQSGTLTTAWGIQPRVINAGKAESLISDARGVDIFINGDLYNRISSDGITNAKALYIRPISSATNTYGIYQEGSNDDNYFAGNVGIGTDNPTNKLQVENGNVVFNDAGGNFDFRVEGDTDANILFTDASTDRVGIGTNTPTAKLEVANGITGSGTLLSLNGTSWGDSEKVYLSWNRAGSYVANIGAELTGGATNANIVFETASNTERMRIASNGNVGIGTDSPTNKLTVIGEASFGTLERTPNNADAAGFYNRIEAGGGTQTTKSYGSIWLYNSNNTQTHSFHSYPGTDNYINNGGNFGIGTASPQAKLDVNGTVQFNNLVRWEYPDKALDADIGTLGYLRTYDETGGYCGLGTSTSSFNIGTSGAINLRFIGQSVERARFDTNGNFIFNEDGNNCDFRIEGDTDPNLLFVDASVDDVGIGTNNPAAKLHVAGDTLFEDLSYRRFTTSTELTTHFRKYTDIAHYANSVSSVDGSLRIEIPVTTSTMWSMDVVIVEYDGVNGNNIKTTNLTITGYTTTNLNKSVLTNNPSRISQVRFGRKSGGNSTIILIDPVSTFRYPKAYIKEINTHHTASNAITFSNSANYAITITSDETDFTLNGTITNDQFIRDDKLVNTFGNQTVAGNKTFDGNVVINEIGGNFDFRVEGDTDANLLSVDASTDRVGIGTSFPSQKLDVSTSEISLAGFNSYPLYAPVASGDYQSLIIENRSDSIITKHMENTANSSSTLVLKNLIRYGANFISIDDAYVAGLGITYYPRLKVNTDTGAVTINESYTFPTSDGSANQYLKTDGNGNVSWAAVTGVGSSLDGTMLSASSSGVIVGSSGWVYQSGQSVLSQGSFGEAIGDAQNSTYLLRTTSVDASWNTLLNNGQSGILLASNRTFQFGVNIVARRTDGHDNAAYKLEGLLYNDGYGCSIIGNPIKTVYGESDESWDVRAVIADSGDSNFLFIEGYGAASKIINWVAKVDLLEVGGNIDGYTKINILNVKSNTLP
jgi:hypothetical protein